MLHFLLISNNCSSHRVQIHASAIRKLLYSLCIKSMKSLCILQSLVASGTILVASVWIASNCLFDSAEHLSHTVSLYSSRGQMQEIYNFSSDFLLSLNLRALRIVQALVHMLFTCAFQVLVLEKVRHKRL